MIVSLPFLFIHPHKSLLEKHLFFSRLKADLLYAQNYAITNQELVSVNFNTTEHFYYIRRYNSELLLERKYAKGIAVFPGSMNLHFRFLSSGNISNFGTIFIEIDQVRYRLTFLIGRGRFYVSKE